MRPLTTSQSFMSCCQAPGEKVSDFAVDLKRLFSGEQMMSAILLQSFLTGLLPAISCQLLLPQPYKMLLIVVEFALTFEAPQEELQDVNVVHHKSTPITNGSPTLQSVLEQITK